MLSQSTTGATRGMAMTENRETQSAGAPVEETEVSDTDVRAAVERAQDPVVGAEPDGAVDTESEARTDASADLPGGEAVTVQAADTEHATVGLDTEPYIATPDIAVPDRLPPVDDEPAATTAAPPPDERARDGEIRISADHPMAALYMQTPVPPEVRGNRGAGALIAVLATLVFALVYAGVLALRVAIDYPPSTFLTEGLLPFLTSWGFIAAAAAFFVGLVVLVLIFGRAGWWAYVLGGFLVAALVWAASTVGYALDPEVMGLTRTSWDPETLARDFGLTIPTLGAALVAREVTVWFGAWIGSRGRKIAAKNAQVLAEYEAALEEVRAKQTA